MTNGDLPGYAMDRGPVTIRNALLRHLPPGASLCVAFSGGRDSTVLLHALASLRAGQAYALRAIHVDHGLQREAEQWAVHCAALAHNLGVPFASVRVPVDQQSGRGLEAAARQARYAALGDALGSGEVLLTAHHAGDQLETVLLHLLRGSGVTGLAGIPQSSRLGAGLLCRPLLGVSPECLDAYGREAGLRWVEDPMNRDRRFDRSYLREAVLPALLARWPAAAGAVSRSGVLVREAVTLLDEVAQGDAGRLVADGRIELAGFKTLGDPRQRNLVRYLAREAGWPVPPERRLREGLAQLLADNPAGRPLLRWAGRELRRYRGHLYLLADGDPAPPRRQPWSPGESLSLGAPRGRLDLEPITGAGLSVGVLARGLEVGFRSGGEKLRPVGDPHHRSLKHLFQCRGVVPWMRHQLPLIYAGGELAAVADLWIADWAATPPGGDGVCVLWTGHAAAF